MAAPLLDMIGTWEEITERAEGLAGRRCHIVIYPIEEIPSTEPSTPLSASELMKLPPHERDRIIAQRSQNAADLYRNDPERTDFEAFDEDDLIEDAP